MSFSSLLMENVAGEDWFRRMRQYLDSTQELMARERETRPFVGFIRDQERGTMETVTFDKSAFTKERGTEHLLSNDIRKLLKITAANRTPEEKNEILMFMKRAIPSFNSYDLQAQKILVSCMWYTQYEQDVVLYKECASADLVYYVLTGFLGEGRHNNKQKREIGPGVRFGDDDIVCGAPRRATVVTTTAVELLCVHRLDYRVIINMADESFKARYLEICRHDPVMQHFPTKKLVDNPSVWTVLSYKYGRLIVQDSNHIDWIYVIISGEANVIKHLNNREINMWERRKIVQQKQLQDNRFHARKKIIQFLEENDAVSANQFKPGLSSIGSKHQTFIHKQRSIQSAPSGEKLKQQGPTLRHVHTTTKSCIRHAETFRPLTRATVRFSEFEVDKPLPAGAQRRMSIDIAKKQGEVAEGQESVVLPEIPAAISEETQGNPDENGGDNTKNFSASNSEGSIENDHTELDQSPNYLAETVDTEGQAGVIPIEQVISIANIPPSSNCFPSILPNKSIVEPNKSTRAKVESERKNRLIKIPPFVQVENLYTGKVFGLRSCLEPEDRGPPASLVSAGCEVLQINKKFFMTQLDDAMMGLINVTHKPYPSEEDLLDRLDNNFQWEEFKQTIVNNSLIQKGKLSPTANQNIQIELRAK